MTAVNSLQTPAASAAEPRAYEPSMEEILASIRRIIADDQSLPGRTQPLAPEPATAAEPALSHDHPASEPVAAASVHVIHAVEPDPVLPPAEIEMPRPLAHGPISAPQFASPEGTHSHDVTDARSAVHAAEPAPEPDLYAEPIDDTAHRESHEAQVWHDSEPTNPVEQLPSHDAPAALFSNATDHSVTAAFNTLAATRLADNSDELLGLAREMIRPLLKTWLDDNLPSMVERMVRAEIERVARGGR